MYLMKDNFQAGIVISQTDELNKFWRQYIPSKYIYPKYEPEILDAVSIARPLVRFKVTERASSQFKEIAWRLVRLHIVFLLAFSHQKASR